MANYKVIRIPVDYEITDEIYSIVNEYLSKQPNPKPFIEPDSTGCNFKFHTLDVDLLNNDVNFLLEQQGDLPLDYRKATQVLHIIANEISKIGSYGIKSGKRQYVDFNIERKVVNRKSKEKDRSKYFYAQNNTFSETNNDLPTEFSNKILCGDSLDILKSFPDNTIDMIFTSPPYNFGMGYDQYIDTNSWENYFDKLYSIFDECIRVLKYGGRFVVNVQPLFSDYIPLHHMISNYLIQRKMIWKGEILWEKNNYNCKYTSWGSWKSPSSPYLKYTWEFIEIFAKGSLKKVGESQNADITADEFKTWVVAKWSIAPERNMKRYGHPAMFPEELAKRAIKLLSFCGDTILDPFNGVGTTTAVAKKLGRNFVGVDISLDYCTTASDRLRDK